MKYVCFKFFNSYRFSSSNLEETVESLDEDDFKILKEELPDHWGILNEKIAYPSEYFIKNEKFQKPVTNLKKKTSSVN